MRSLLFALSLLTTTTLLAQEIKIIPEPVSVVQKNGSFRFTNKTKIVSSKQNERQYRFLNAYLKKAYGFELPVSNNLKDKGIVLKTGAPGAKADAYTLDVDANGVTIQGSGAGLLYGVSSFIQLLPYEKGGNAFSVPYCSIKDQPRFEYRGLMLDVARHFEPVDYVKKVIDYMTLYKLNTFHWHLTEDQGWRIEIKKYPKLTQVGGWRNGTIIGRYPGKGNDDLHYGGYYTQAQIKEIVQYAKDRFITVIPEIELPGHASAAIAAYPELSCFPNVPTKQYFPKNCTWSGDSTGKQVQQTWGVFDDVFDPSKELTFTFLQNVLDEVMALFPSKYIHIGGDECPKTNWKKSPSVQALMKEKGLKDEHEVQSYFITRIEKYLNSKGRNIIGWDEILEGGLAPNATVMSWRGEQGGIDAAKSRHDVVMTPGSHLYFDHSQTRSDDSVTIGGYLPVETVYSYNPTPKELPEEYYKYIKGAQANLWTEYVKNPSKVEYMLFPRMAALSEVTWTKSENKNWNQFQGKLNRECTRYRLLGINYSKAVHTVVPEPDKQH